MSWGECPQPVKASWGRKAFHTRTRLQQKVTLSLPSDLGLYASLGRPSPGPCPKPAGLEHHLKTATSRGTCTLALGGRCEREYFNGSGGGCIFRLWGPGSHSQVVVPDGHSVPIERRTLAPSRRRRWPPQPGTGLMVCPCHSPAFRWQDTGHEEVCLIPLQNRIPEHQKMNMTPSRDS